MQFSSQFTNAFVAQPPFSRNGDFLLSATVYIYISDERYIPEVEMKTI